jgi:hypothetical protein
VTPKLPHRKSRKPAKKRMLIIVNPVATTVSDQRCNSPIERLSISPLAFHATALGSRPEVSRFAPVLSAQLLESLSNRVVRGGLFVLNPLLLTSSSRHRLGA